MSDERTVILGMLPSTAPLPQVPPDAVPLPQGTQVEEFQIRGVVGMGGFGVVYQAWDTRLEREVALKEYFPINLACRTAEGHVQVRHADQHSVYEAGLRSFINEARLLARFDHPGLVKVYRFWESAGTAFMVMPLYRGQTLKQWFAQLPQPTQASELLRVVRTLGQALAVMHEAGCLHRDIAPDNILVLHDKPEPVLLDFGAARQTIGPSAQALTVVVKASYAPPEQYSDDASQHQGPWTDVYALAAVMHDLMTGRPPPTAMARMVKDNYQPLATLGLAGWPLPLCQAIDRALQLNTQARTRTVTEFLAALEHTVGPDALNAFFTESSTTPPPQTEPNLPNKPPATRLGWGRNPWLAGGFALLLVGAFVGALVGIWPLNTPTPEVPQAQPQKHASTGETLGTGSANEPAWNSAQLLDETFARAQQGRLVLTTDHPVLTVGKDLLEFTVTSPVDGVVTVYVHTTDGQLVRLLPNERVPSVAVKAGQTLALPPRSEAIQSAGPPGRNRLLVVVSAAPINNPAGLNWGDHHGYGWLDLVDWPKNEQGAATLARALVGPSPDTQAATLDINEQP